MTFGDTAPTVTAPSGAQTALSYSATPATVCTVGRSSGALTIMGAGNCEVTVTAAVTADYEVATAMFTVAVAKGAQPLTGFRYSAASVTFGDTAPAVTMPSGAQGALSYSATAPAVCTVDPVSGALTIVGVGDCEVTVTAAVTADYEVATAMFTVTVAQGAQTLSGFQYSSNTVTFGDTAPTVTAPSGAQTALSYSAMPPAVCTVNPNSGVLTLEEVGDCEVTVTAVGTANYEVATAMFTVTVGPAGVLVLKVNAIATDGTVNIAEKAAGFAISGDTGSVGGVTVTVRVGVQELTAVSSTDNPAIWSVDVPGNAAYIVGSSVAVTVSAAKTGYTAPNAQTPALAVDLVGPVAPTYTAPSSLRVGVAIAEMNPTVGGADIDEYGAPGLPSGLSIDAGSGVIGGTPDTANASTASVRVTVKDTAGNAATVDIAFPMVAKGDQALSGFQYSASSVTFGDTAPAVTMPSGAQGALSYSATPSTVCTVGRSSGALTIVGAGDCEVTVTAAVTADYEVATAMFTVAVAKGAQTLTGFRYSAISVTFGDTAPTVTAPSAQTALSYSAMPATVCTVGRSSGVLTIMGAGARSSGHGGGHGDYEVATAMFTVAKGAQPLTGFRYSAASVTFGDTAPAVTMPSGAQGALSYSATAPAVCTVDPVSGALTIVGVGDCEVTVTAAVTADYEVATAMFTVTVAQGAQTLSGFQYSSNTVTFGDTAPTVTAPSGAQTALSYSAMPLTVCTVEPSTAAYSLWWRQATCVRSRSRRRAPPITR